jgi:hypothetical protein
MSNSLETIIEFISVLISFCYVIIICIKYGIPDSVSMSYYDLKPRIRIVFQLFIWSLSLSIMLLSENWLMLVGGGLLSIIGFTPTIEEKKRPWIPKLHMISAISSVVALIASTLFFNNFHWYFFIVLFLYGVTVVFSPKRTILFFIEVISALYIYTYLFF